MKVVGTAGAKIPRQELAGEAGAMRRKKGCRVKPKEPRVVVPDGHVQSPTRPLRVDPRVLAQAGAGADSHPESWFLRQHATP